MPLPGGDNRTQVTSFTGSGFSSIVAVDAVRSTLRGAAKEAPGVGSGIQIADNFVLSVGHNTFDTFKGVAHFGGRITPGAAVSGLLSRPTERLTRADLDFLAEHVAYPDRYDALNGIPNYDTRAFARDISVILTPSGVGATTMGMVAFVDPATARNLQITTAGFPALLEPGSVNAGKIAYQSSTKTVTEALLAYTASGTVASATSDGRFGFSHSIDAEAGQSGSGLWTPVDVGDGTTVDVVIGVLSGGSSAGIFGHLITLDEYAAIHDAMDANRLYLADRDRLPTNYIIGSDRNDVVTGAFRNEVIRAGRGDDRVAGGGGDDVVEGGEGIDHARFSGEIGDYEIQILDASDPDQPTVRIAHRGGGADGTDETRGVEFAVFEFGDAGRDGTDDDGRNLFVPLLADLDDPTKLRDGDVRPDAVEILDGGGARLGTLQLESPTYMFDGDIDYTLRIGQFAQLYNIVYIVDSSGSMSGAPMAETKAAFQSLTEYIRNAGLASRTNFAVVDFDSYASLYPNLTADEAIARVNALYAGGGTYFGTALNYAESWLESVAGGSRKNIAYFLSDGFGSGASSSLQLINEGQADEAVVDVRAFGIGLGADLSALDIIDSGSATRLTSASQLGQALASSGFSRDSIERIRVTVGGTEVDVISPDDLVEDTLGLSFTGEIDGLEVSIDAATEIAFIADFNDGTPSVTLTRTVTTGQDEQRNGTAINLGVRQTGYSARGEGESISANALNNEITLMGGGNEVFAHGGADLIVVGEGGNDFVDGGEGVDTVRLSIARAEATDIRVSGDLTSVGEGLDMVNVEFIEFTDMRIDAATLSVTPEIRVETAAPAAREGDGTLRVVLTLSTAADADVTVDYATSAVGAQAGEDFAAATGSVDFRAGETRKEIAVQILDDAAAEGDETFALDLAVTEGATFAQGREAARVEATITDDDTLILRASTGDDGTPEGGRRAPGIYRVELERVGDLSGEDVIAWTASRAGGADSADRRDFVGPMPSGEIAFAAGDSTAVAEIALKGDGDVEKDEFFRLSFAAVSGESTLALDDVVVAIGNDDAWRVIRGTAESDRLVGSARWDRIKAGDGDDLLKGKGGVDALKGEAGDDRLLGQNGADRLFGGRDADALLGGEGGDALFGGKGRDLLLGGDGRDELVGGKGADLLTGGLGADRLKGGKGADLFDFAVGDGRDRILDWQDGVDRIQLRGGPASLADLVVEDARAGARVSYGERDSILLAGATAAELDATDFLFA